MSGKKYFKGGKVVLPDRVIDGGLLVENGVITAVVHGDASIDAEVIDVSGKVLFPGVLDTHAHMCSPGVEDYREDWFHGTQAAAAGGITTIIEMPLSMPPVENKDTFDYKYKAAKKDSHVDFALWGGLTPNSIPHLEEMNELGCCAYKGFMSLAGPSYPQITDGYLVQAMEIASKFNGLIGLHAENAEAAEFGAQKYHDEKCTDYSKWDEARPWWVELEAIQRAVLFSQVHDVRLLVCHMSIPEGAEFLQQSKLGHRGLYIETCPHYLIFDKTDINRVQESAKCNPPLRSRESVEALWEFIFDGSIDVIGSDHGPYTDEEKKKEGSFWKEYSGFSGFELMLPALVSEGVNKRGLPLPRLAELLAGNAAKIFELYPKKGTLLPGADADIVVLDMEKEWTWKTEDTFSKTVIKNSIWNNHKMKGKIAGTYCRGELVYDGDKIVGKNGYGEYVKRDPQ